MNKPEEILKDLSQKDIELYSMAAHTFGTILPKIPFFIFSPLGLIKFNKGLAELYLSKVFSSKDFSKDEKSKVLVEAAVNWVLVKRSGLLLLQFVMQIISIILIWALFVR